MILKLRLCQNRVSLKQCSQIGNTAFNEFPGCSHLALDRVGRGGKQFVRDRFEFALTRGDLLD
jgi:hypothetical protein